MGEGRKKRSNDSVAESKQRCRGMLMSAGCWAAVWLVCIFGLFGSVWFVCLLNLFALFACFDDIIRRVSRTPRILPQTSLVRQHSGAGGQIFHWRYTAAPLL